MTIAELYDTARGTRPSGPARSFNDGPRPDFYGLTEDTWRRDPHSNPMLSEPNDDYRLMAYNEQVQNLADQLLKKNQANQAEQRVAMLRSLLQQPNVNLFDTPTNDTELSAQRIVQDHINAGNRGVASWLAGLREAKAQRQANFDRSLRLRNQALQESRYRNDVAKERALLPLDIAQKKASIANIGTDNARNAEALSAQISNRKAGDAARQAAALEKRFNEALGLVGAGVPPSELINAYPDLTDQHFAALDAAARHLSQGETAKFNAIKSAAENYSNELSSRLDNAETAYEDSDANQRSYLNPMRYFSGASSATPEGRQQARERMRQAFLGTVGKEFGKAGVRYDEATGTVVPIQQAPQPYVPLERAGGRSSSFTGGGVPVVRVPADLDRFSDYPSVRTPDGRTVVNPRYRPAERIAPPSSVQSVSLPGDPNMDWESGYGYTPQYDDGLDSLMSGYGSTF